MTLPYPISSTQTDALSPVDDNLMDSIRLDLDYLDGSISSSVAAFTFNVNGALSVLRGNYLPQDSAVVASAFTPVRARAVIKRGGTSGSLTFDIRKLVASKTPIIEIAHQHDAATQSISNIAPALATQSIARVTPQISTQSISHAESTLSTQSVISLGGNRWRYNFSGSVLGSRYAVGKSVTFASHSSGGNDGTFAIVAVNDSGHPSIVVSNTAGVAQTGAAGTAQLKLMSYNYTNPVSTEFVAGESAVFATHTTGANNGTFEIFAINASGNNILVYNSTGATQAGVAGTADVSRWKYAFSGAASTTDFIVGEKLKASSHTSGANDGNFIITAVNSGGNNLVAYNTAGVAQGGVAGVVNTNRWIYALGASPAANITAGDSVSMESHTTAANNGIFVVKEVNRSASNNTVIYNVSGVAQAGAVGNTRTVLKLIKFTADQSAVYSTLSYIEMDGCAVTTYNKLETKQMYRVVQVNRGGGSNFNVVIDAQNGQAQVSPAGYIQLEAKSIFSAANSIASDLTADKVNQMLNSVFTNVTGVEVAAQTPIALYLTSIPSGSPEDLTVNLY